jgi:glycosyltransferase involved in cell wall biosynthesis
MKGSFSLRSPQNSEAEKRHFGVGSLLNRNLRSNPANHRVYQQTMQWGHDCMPAAKHLPRDFNARTAGLNPERARVLYLDHGLVWGGAEVVLLNMIRALNRDLFDPIVATSENSPMLPYLAEANIESTVLPFGGLRRAGVEIPRNLFQSVFSIAKAIRRLEISLVHTNTVRAHIVGSLASLLTRRPLIWSLHDNTLPHSLARLLSPLPDRVIAVSQWLRDEYAHSGLGRKTEVVYNGLAPQAASDPLSVREELGIPADAFVVLNVGRLVAGKAPSVFIKAGRIVCRENPKAYFVLVGGEDPLEKGRPALSELNSLIRAAGDSKRILVTGHRPDIMRFYAAADVFVYSAVQPEGLPTVLLEAMCYGKPIVASGIGGAREIVQENVTGLIVPPGDSEALASVILKVLQDPEGSRIMGIAGRSHLEHVFGLKIQVKKIEGIYSECLQL